MAVLNRALPRSRSKSAADISSAALRLRPILATAAVAITIIGLLQIVQTSQATTATFQIQKLERQKLELGVEVRQLEADVGALSSLSRIELEAARLGLARPQSMQAVEVNVASENDSADQLPTRFSAGGQVQLSEAEQDEAWWQDLLGLLPFD